jgi:hypothetical protein
VRRHVGLLACGAALGAAWGAAAETAAFAAFRQLCAATDGEPQAVAAAARSAGWASPTPGSPPPNTADLPIHVDAMWSKRVGDRQLKLVLLTGYGPGVKGSEPVPMMKACKIEGKPADPDALAEARSWLGQAPLPRTGFGEMYAFRLQSGQRTPLGVDALKDRANFVDVRFVTLGDDVNAGGVALDWDRMLVSRAP